MIESTRRENRPGRCDTPPSSLLRADVDGTISMKDECLSLSILQKSRLELSHDENTSRRVLSQEKTDRYTQPEPFGQTGPGKRD